MNKGDLKIERLQQYLDRQKGVVESNIKEYNQQLEKNYLYFFGWHAVFVQGILYESTLQCHPRRILITPKLPKI